MSLMICRGHIRASKGTLQIFLWLMVLCENRHFSQILHFCLHFGCDFKGSKMGYEVKYHINCQSQHGLSDSSAKTGKFLPECSQEQKTCTFLGPKAKNFIYDGASPHLHTKPNLYECRKV